MVSSLLTGATRIAYAIDPHSLRYSNNTLFPFNSLYTYSNMVASYAHFSLCLSVMLSFVLAFCHLWLEVDIESLSDVRLIVIGIQ